MMVQYNYRNTALPYKPYCLDILSAAVDYNNKVAFTFNNTHSNI